ncbi:MAG: gfo/Idh/MocA family oxidoreductase [Chitinophagaceae bacterium]|nr:gfo/Idh/MocA family oxidoreductase [Chitinophagaceae bacterium]
MKRKLKFAILGCGKIAQRHAAEAAKLGIIAAVCDTDKGKADLLAGEYHAEPFYQLDDLLDKRNDIDIISVCTPNGLHAKHSIQSLGAGIHVLCEKPMAIASADAIAMIKAAEKNNRKLYVVKQNRFNPPVSFARNLIEQKKMGKIVSFQLNCFWNRPGDYYKNTWRGTKNMDGGILYTQFSHFIDILYWFLGDMVSVTGSRSNLMHKDCIEFEDTGIAMLEMRDKIIGSLHYSINSYAKNMEGSFTIFGEKGTLKIGGQYLNELEYFSVENEVLPILPKGNPANEYGFYQGSMSNHDKVYEAFTKAIADPSYPLVSAYETMKTVEIIEKIYKASPFLS